MVLPRRGPRDWTVDILMFVFAVGFGLLTGAERESDPTVPAWLFTLDQVTAAAGCAALWLRRRWPVQLAVALLLLATFSELVGGALLVSLFVVALHRPFRTTMLVGLLSFGSGIVYAVVRPDPQLSPLATVVLGVVLWTAVTGWGMFVRSRRLLVESLRERAVRAETEARLLAEQAQHRAREQIAREMHDVLGHRLSLLSVYAGALEYRPDAPAEEIGHAAAVIRESAHQALQDLREVINVLRAPTGELPQPTLVDVRNLVAESGRAGMRVELSQDAPPDTPTGTGRAAYRIVQEALTNVRKHAPGAGVRVAVTGAPGAGLTVEVTNTAPPDPPDRSVTPEPAPGSGQGLIGLAERASLAGGRLRHGPTSDGGFRLAAWLPWPP